MPQACLIVSDTVHCNSPLKVSAERQGALTSLDYALAAGSQPADQAKADVEASLRHTSEQVP